MARSVKDRIRSFTVVDAGMLALFGGAMTLLTIELMKYDWAKRQDSASMLKFHEMIAPPDTVANRWRYVVLAAPERTCKSVQDVSAQLPVTAAVLLLRENTDQPERCSPDADVAEPARMAQWRSAYALMRSEGANAALLDRRGRVVFASRDATPANNLRQLLAPTPEPTILSAAH